MRAALLISVWVTLGSARAADLDLRSWKTAGSVQAIAQTADGFLWLGTPSGLRRFDGVGFVGVDDNPVRRLLAARDGALWIATGRGFVERTTDGQIDFKNRSDTAALMRFASGRFARWGAGDGLPSEWVWSLVEDASGAVWIGTERGLARWQDGRITAFAGAGAPDGPVLALLADPTGDLWIGTAAGLLVRRHDRFERTGVKQPVLSMTRDARGRLWLGINLMVASFLDGQLHPVESERPAHVLVGDPRGNVWVGTDIGLRRLDTTREGATLAPTGIDRWIASIAADREGSVWVGTRVGDVTQLRTPPVRNLGPPEGLGAPIAFAVLAAGDGSFWITTTEGVARFVDGALISYRSERDLHARMLRALAEGRDGSVWLGSWYDGLLRFQDGRFRRYRRADGLAADDVRSVLVDGAGALWVTFVHTPGLQRFGSGVVDGGGAVMGKAEGLCGGSLVALAAGRGGRLWLGSDEGLAVVDGGRARCLGEKDGLPAGRPASAVEDEQGTLWITVQDAGLVRLRDGRFTTLPREAGLRDGAPLGLVDDRRGHLWMTGIDGPKRVAVADLDAAFDGRAGPLPAVVYDADAGMRSAECTGWFAPGSAVARDGRLWVPTLAGVSVLPVPEEEPRPAADVVIDGVLVDGRRAAAQADGLRLPRGGGELDMQFTAPALAQPARLRFRYRLDGIDRRWIEAGPLRRARYPRLGPGRYLFRVAAQDHLGRAVGREATLAVVVPPPLYQTPAFLALCAASIIAGVFGLHRRRVRLIEARHAAVHAERARIARDLHDSLGQAFASIGLLVDGCMLLPELPDRVRETLRQTRHVVDLCHEDTRRSIWNIRDHQPSPPALGTLLERIVSGFPRRAPIRLSVTGAPVAVPPLLGHELGHIAREAIANAVSHAEAARIDVEARCDDDGLALQVKDDGRGLPATSEAGAGGIGGGIGILGMKERASRIGGVLTIAPGARGGTEVTLRVPRRELDRLTEKAS